MNDPRLFADEPVELCPWTVPDDAVHKGHVTDCLGLPDHDGPHLVGLAGNGWARIFAVDTENRMMSEVVHARLDNGPTASREELAALNAVLALTRRRPA